MIFVHEENAIAFDICSHCTKSVVQTNHPTRARYDIDFRKRDEVYFHVGYTQTFY